MSDRIMEIQFKEGEGKENEINKIFQVRTEKVVIVFEGVEYTAHFDAAKNLVITKFSKFGSAISEQKLTQINEIRIK